MIAFFELIPFSVFVCTDCFAGAQNFSSQRVQVHICRILLMVPVYSIVCLVSLRQNQEFVYWQTLRELYESCASTSLTDSRPQAREVVDRRLIVC